MSFREHFVAAATKGNPARAQVKQVGFLSNVYLAKMSNYISEILFSVSGLAEFAKVAPTRNNNTSLEFFF